MHRSEHKTYEEAYSKAQKLADDSGKDFGLLYNKVLRFWLVFSLPQRDARYAYGDYNHCQVVYCTDFKKRQPGHGPVAEEKYRL